jgi:transposase InsO family protein
MMGIARSTYYDKPAISVDDTALVETMVGISDSFDAYGYRRMQAALRHRGFVVNHKKIRRLMREHDLQPRRRRRYVATTDGDHDLPIFPNLARRTSSGWPTSAYGHVENANALTTCPQADSETAADRTLGGVIKDNQQTDFQRSRHQKRSRCAGPLHSVCCRNLNPHSSSLLRCFTRA